jgi:CHASE2 domain-containing sensor protein
VFNQYNIIRENVEDFAFDITNVWSISQKEQVTDSERVTIFTFDNQYMEKNGLFDVDEDSEKKEKNIANYGYIFPREHIARFIERLDARLGKLSKISSFTCPKALFIDFDLSFPTGTNINQTPLAENLTKGDKHLLKTLENTNRCYKILLVQNNKFNFIKDYASDQLSRLIQGNKISFVSPYFHASADGTYVVRRYEPIKKIAGETYPTAAIALWQISKTGMIDVKAVEQQFPDAVKKYTQPKDIALNKNRGNVNDNMIWIKNYKAVEEYQCPEKSYWSGLRKYAIACTETIPHKDLNNTVLMLGGTYRENNRYNPGTGDYYSVLKFFNIEQMSGIDIHANILMTLFHLDQAIQPDKKPL